MKRIIAVVGPIASGKGVVINFFKQKGYKVLSLSDVVREKAKELELPITRENLQNTGDQLRQAGGNAILAQEIAPEIQKNPEDDGSANLAPSRGKFVIDAIRNPAEVEFFKKNFDAYSIGVTADAKRRFENMRARGKEYDPKTWEEFEKAEQRDRGVGQEDYGQQVEKCLEMADIVLENNSTKEELEEKIRLLLSS